MEPNFRGTETVKQGDYVDTRSVWPTYFNGFVAVQLPGKDRNIPVEAAREIVADLLK